MSNKNLDKKNSVIKTVQTDNSKWATFAVFSVANANENDNVLGNGSATELKGDYYLNQSFSIPENIKIKDGDKIIDAQTAVLRTPSLNGYTGEVLL